ncbi:MAG: succinate--CoA ligase subunit alpha [Peptococcaceae bacterium]|jgi:succinyl-CoA synthetase alpha subunit|nr:succinate--CoA ligase subunit alpha [Peptococcaceae bacterium]
MGILVDRNSRVGIVGITGLDAMAAAKDMLNYGTPVLAGISPGRRGERIQEIPVYDTVRQAVEEQGVNTMLIYAPPAFILDAVQETLASDIKLMVIPTEKVPNQDVLKAIYEIKAVGARMIGPNTIGLIHPLERVKLGAIGGDKVERCFIPGCVGVISRSAGMTAETAHMIKKSGLGVSTAVNIGGDALIGTTPKELLELFERDPQTKAVILFTERNILLEEEVMEFIGQGSFSKPLIAAIAGKHTLHMLKKPWLGYEKIADESADKWSEKLKRLKAAGVHVADKYDDIITILQDLELEESWVV